MYSVNLEEWRGPRPSWFKCRRVYLEYRLSPSLLRPSSCPWARVSYPLTSWDCMHSSRVLVTVQYCTYSPPTAYVLLHMLIVISLKLCCVQCGLPSSFSPIYLYPRLFDVKMSSICWTCYLFLLCLSCIFRDESKRISLSRRKVLFFLRSCKLLRYRY